METIGDRDPTSVAQPPADTISQAEVPRLTHKATQKHLGDAESAGESVMRAVMPLREAMKEYETASKRLHATLADLRDTRMGIVGEINHILPALRDVREFFLGPDFADQRRRLLEFVELCERLKALRDSGFLDDVAGTLLKLAE